MTEEKKPASCSTEGENSCRDEVVHSLFDLFAQAEELEKARKAEEKNEEGK